MSSELNNIINFFLFGNDIITKCFIDFSISNSIYFKIQIFKFFLYIISYKLMIKIFDEINYYNDY